MPPPFSSRDYWLCQVLGWLLYVTLALVMVAVFPPGPPLSRFIAVYLAAGGLGIASTHLYRLWVRPRRWLRLGLWRLLPRVVASSVVVGAILTALVTALYFAAFPSPFLHSEGLLWVYPALYAWIGACVFWNVAYFGVHFFTGYRQAEMEKLQLLMAAQGSELRALLAQLNPHFLFNCLNSVRALIGEDPQRAQGLVTELSQLLRYTLTAGRRPLVPLRDELEAVEAYLKLESARLEERLQVELSADPAALGLPLPPMLLQTLVENAVKHGVAPLAGGGRVRIAARLLDGRLQLEVENSGQLGGGSDSTRVGLENARERLRLLYGGAARLSLRNQGCERVLAEVSLPPAAAALAAAGALE
ncbi:MAG: sensor histidine kinase [Terriglobales bacterium]